VRLLGAEPYVVKAAVTQTRTMENVSIAFSRKLHSASTFTKYAYPEKWEQKNMKNCGSHYNDIVPSKA